MYMNMYRYLFDDMQLTHPKAGMMHVIHVRLSSLISFDRGLIRSKLQLSFLEIEIMRRFQDPKYTRSIYKHQEPDSSKSMPRYKMFKPFCFKIQNVKD